MSFKRIHTRIAHELGVAILAGKHGPGERLEGEIEYSERMQISRTAYREALRILSSKGLVESRPKTGTRIAPRSRWNLLDPDVLAWIMEATPSEGFVRDLFELRLMVEPNAAALAATRRNGRDLARMGHALEEMERHGLTTAEGQAADVEFHRALMEATRNEALITLSSTIETAVGSTTYFKVRHGVTRDSVPDHRELFDTIVEASPDDAREAMIDLINKALEDMKVTLDNCAESAT